MLARALELRLDQGPVMLRLPAAEVGEFKRCEDDLELPTSLVDRIDRRYTVRWLLQNAQPCVGDVLELSLCEVLAVRRVEQS